MMVCLTVIRSVAFSGNNAIKNCRQAISNVRKAYASTLVRGIKSHSVCNSGTSFLAFLIISEGFLLPAMYCVIRVMDLLITVSSSALNNIARISFPNISYAPSGIRPLEPHRGQRPASQATRIIKGSVRLNCDGKIALQAGLRQIAGIFGIGSLFVVINYFLMHNEMHQPTRHKVKNEKLTTLIRGLLNAAVGLSFCPFIVSKT